MQTPPKFEPYINPNLSYLSRGYLTKMSFCCNNLAVVVRARYNKCNSNVSEGGLGCTDKTIVSHLAHNPLDKLIL